MNMNVSFYLVRCVKFVRTVLVCCSSSFERPAKVAVPETSTNFRGLSSGPARSPRSSACLKSSKALSMAFPKGLNVADFLPVDSASRMAIWLQHTSGNTAKYVHTEREREGKKQKGID